LDGAVERGGDDSVRPAGGDSGCYCGGLLPTDRAEAKAIQIGVNDVIGVVDFAMSDEMQRMEHGVRVYRRP
jgi:hypothetical protein